jgi:hypothetical protein
MSARHWGRNGDECGRCMRAGEMARAYMACMSACNNVQCAMAASYSKPQCKSANPKFAHVDSARLNYAVYMRTWQIQNPGAGQMCVVTT